MSVYFFSGRAKSTETASERRARENAEHADLILRKRIDAHRMANPKFWKMVDSPEFRDWWENEACGNYDIFSKTPMPEALPMLVDGAREQIRKAEEEKLLASTFLYDPSISAEDRRRIKQGLATPPWADRKAIREIYAECRMLNQEYGFAYYHVDHVIPIQGKYVSGLHVEGNLEIIEAKANLAKRNSYEGY